MKEKASSSEATSTHRATRLGRIARGAFATRAASLASDGSSASSAGSPSTPLRLALLAAAVAAFFLFAVAAQASAAGVITVEPAAGSTGEGTVTGGSSGEPLNCHIVDETKSGDCETHSENGSGTFEALTFTMAPEGGATFKEWNLTPAPAFGTKCNSEQKEALSCEAIVKEEESATLTAKLEAPAPSHGTITVEPAAGSTGEGTVTGGSSGEPLNCHIVDETKSGDCETHSENGSGTFEALTFTMAPEGGATFKEWNLTPAPAFGTKCNSEQKEALSCEAIVKEEESATLTAKLEAPAPSHGTITVEPAAGSTGEGTVTGGSSGEPLNCHIVDETKSGDCETHSENGSGTFEALTFTMAPEGGATFKEWNLTPAPAFGTKCNSEQKEALSCEAIVKEEESATLTAKLEAPAPSHGTITVEPAAGSTGEGTVTGGSSGEPLNCHIVDETKSGDCETHSENGSGTFEALTFTMAPEGGATFKEWNLTPAPAFGTKCNSEQKEALSCEAIVKEEESATLTAKLEAPAPSHGTITVEPAAGSTGEGTVTGGSSGEPLNCHIVDETKSGDCETHSENGSGTFEALTFTMAPEGGATFKEWNLTPAPAFGTKCNSEQKEALSCEAIVKEEESATLTAKLEAPAPSHGTITVEPAAGSTGEGTVTGGSSGEPLNCHIVDETKSGDCETHSENGSGTFEALTFTMAPEGGATFKEWNLTPAPAFGTKCNSEQKEALSCEAIVKEEESATLTAKLEAPAPSHGTITVEPAAGSTGEGTVTGGSSGEPLNCHIVDETKSGDCETHSENGSGTFEALTFTMAPEGGATFKEWNLTPAPAFGTKCNSEQKEALSCEAIVKEEESATLTAKLEAPAPSHGTITVEPAAGSTGEGTVTGGSSGEPLNCHIVDETKSGDCETHSENGSGTFEALTFTMAPEGGATFKEWNLTPAPAFGTKCNSEQKEALSCEAIVKEEESATLTAKLEAPAPSHGTITVEPAAGSTGEGTVTGGSSGEPLNCHIVDETKSGDCETHSENGSGTFEALTFTMAPEGGATFKEWNLTPAPAFGTKCNSEQKEALSCEAIVKEEESATLTAKLEAPAPSHGTITVEPAAGSTGEGTVTGGSSGEPLNCHIVDETKSGDCETHSENGSGTFEALTFTMAPEGGATFKEWNLTPAPAFGTKCNSEQKEALSCEAIVKEEESATLTAKLEAPAPSHGTITVEPAAGSTGEGTVTGGSSGEPLNCHIVDETKSGDCETHSENGSGTFEALTFTMAPEGGATFKEWNLTPAPAFGTKCNSEQKEALSCEAIVKEEESATLTAKLEAPAVPTVSAVAPSSGPEAGGTEVTITGTNLTGATEVKYGTAAVTCTEAVATCKVESDTEIKATTPTHAAETVDVHAVTPAGESAANPPGDEFTFEAVVVPPVLTSVSPDEGPAAGGQTVTISGEHLTGASKVEFDSTEVTSGEFLAESDTEIEVATPSHGAGAVDVSVTTPGGSDTATGAYTYVEAPTVTELEPNHGPASGANAVKIKGTDLEGASKVDFGPVEITSGEFLAESGTEIDVEAPAGTAGETVDVTVTTVGGTSATGSESEYTYDFEAPVITGVSPDEGPAAGGQTVTICGEHLTGASKVEFDTTEVTSGEFLAESDTEIEVATPSHGAGAVDVSVTTPGGSDTATGAYTYVEAPTVTELEPNHGPASGANAVKIKGTDLEGASKVDFGPVEITSGEFLAESGTEIDVEAPAGTAGETVDVTVTTVGGTSATGSESEYTYDFEAPVITGVAPDEGPAAGGQTVTISGEHLTGASKVEFDTTEITSGEFLAESDTEIEVATPSHGAGAVDVSVTTPGGSDTATGAYTYVEAPTVTSCTPSEIPAAGGATVTIEGTDLGGATEVLFGSSPATISTDTATKIEAAAPPHMAGSVTITVVTPGGSDTCSITYVAAPTISSVSPDEGPTSGGQTVTIEGTNLENVSAVDFGASAGSGLNEVSATKIEIVTPSGSGTVDVEVTTPGGTDTAAGAYTYVAAPTISSVSPDEGPTSGGQTVTIEGTNLENVSAVDFGASAGSGLNEVSATKIEIVTPSGSGTVDVEVTTPGGSDTAAGAYTYVAAPTVSSVVPGEGPTAGGTVVTITGANLTGASKVEFGGTAVTCDGTVAHCKVESGTEVKATSPAHPEGTVDVTVTTAGGTSATSAADHFFYETPERSLTIEEGGSGSGSVQCDTGSGPEACQSSYPTGSAVVVIATPAGNSVFTEWTGECDSVAGNECEVTLSADKTIEAVFDLAQRTLTVAKAGSGDGSFECDSGSGFGACAATYTDGTTIALRATPGAHSTFDGWSGAGCSGTGICVVLGIGADTTVTATFTARTYSLTVNKVGPGSGSVSCDGGACASSYPEGTTVTLTAAADSGSSFTGWAGGGCSGTGNCVVTLNADTTVTASFETNPPPPPPPPAGTAIAPAKATVKGNKAFIGLTCKGGGACKGVLKLFAKLPVGGKKSKHKRNHRKSKLVLIGKRSFSIAAGKSKTIKVKIANRKARQLLRKRGKLVARVRGPGVRTRNVQLRQRTARKRHRHHHKRHRR